MFFKTIAAIAFTACASLSFANTVHAESQTLNTTYSSVVLSSCGLSYANGTGQNVLLNGTSAGLTATGYYSVTCNDPSAAITLAVSPTTLIDSAGNTLSSPANVDTKVGITYAYGDFSNSATGNVVKNASVNAGATNANGGIYVSVAVTPTSGTLPQGSYSVPTNVTLTYQ